MAQELLFKPGGRWLSGGAGMSKFNLCHNGTQGICREGSQVVIGEKLYKCTLHTQPHPHTHHTHAHTHTHTTLCLILVFFSATQRIKHSHANVLNLSLKYTVICSKASKKRIENFSKSIFSISSFFCNCDIHTENVIPDGHHFADNGQVYFCEGTSERYIRHCQIYCLTA